MLCDMMTSYQSLLSMSPADWIGGGESVGYGGDAGREAFATAAVSSYLSFDVGEEVWSYHPSEEEAFRAEQQQAPPLFDALQQADYSVSGGGAAAKASPAGGARRRRSAALSSEGALASQYDNSSGSACAGAGGATSLPRLPVIKHSKIAFKTRSEVDVLDDGYRWRKYGKKLVKNSPNPRNYYRCSSQGCQVKKRVERARDDAGFVITTYDGVHNHPAAPAHSLRGYRLADPPPQGHRV